MNAISFTVMAGTACLQLNPVHATPSNRCETRPTTIRRISISFGTTDGESIVRSCCTNSPNVSKWPVNCVWLFDHQNQNYLREVLPTSSRKGLSRFGHDRPLNTNPCADLPEGIYSLCTYRCASCSCMLEPLCHPLQRVTGVPNRCFAGGKIYDVVCMSIHRAQVLI